jgi:hypothetical protein
MHLLKSTASKALHRSEFGGTSAKTKTGKQDNKVISIFNETMFELF